MQSESWSKYNPQYMLSKLKLKNSKYRKQNQTFDADKANQIHISKRINKISEFSSFKHFQALFKFELSTVKIQQSSSQNVYENAYFSEQKRKEFVVFRNNLFFRRWYSYKNYPKKLPCKVTYYCWAKHCHINVKTKLLSGTSGSVPCISICNKCNHVPEARIVNFLTDYLMDSMAKFIQSEQQSFSNSRDLYTQAKIKLEQLVEPEYEKIFLYLHK